MKRIIATLSAFVVLFSLSACGKVQEAPTENTTASTISETSISMFSEATEQETPITETTKPQTTTTKPDLTVGTTQAQTTTVIGDPTKPQTTESTQSPSTYRGTTIVDNFVITKVSGTYLELHKVIYGSDTEKLVYCCDFGNLDGSADMQFRAGDDVTIRYDVEIAETIPLRLTAREIYPSVWN